MFYKIQFNAFSQMLVSAMLVSRVVPADEKISGPVGVLREVTFVGCSGQSIELSDSILDLVRRKPLRLVIS